MQFGPTRSTMLAGCRSFPTPQRAFQRKLHPSLAGVGRMRPSAVSLSSTSKAKAAGVGRLRTAAFRAPHSRSFSSGASDGAPVEMTKEMRKAIRAYRARERVAKMTAAFSQTRTKQLYEGEVLSVNNNIAVVSDLEAAYPGAVVQIYMDSNDPEAPPPQWKEFKTRFQQLPERPGSVPGVVVGLLGNSTAQVLMMGSGVQGGHKCHMRPGKPVPSSALLGPLFPIGSGLKGRIVDVLGVPIDGQGPLEDVAWRPYMNSPPPRITSRARSHETGTVLSGLKLMDLRFPISKGQRAAFVGPPGAGQFDVVLDVIQNQMRLNDFHEKFAEEVQEENRAEGKSPTPLAPHLRRRPLHVVWVVCGRTEQHLVQVRKGLKRVGALESSTIIAAPQSQIGTLQYLAPLTGATVAEYWRDQGADALVVYDDLATHGAVADDLAQSSNYSLDAAVQFHSKLMERAAALRPNSGRGSITALALVTLAAKQDNDGSEFTHTPDIKHGTLEKIKSIVDQCIEFNPMLRRKRLYPAIDILQKHIRLSSHSVPAAYGHQHHKLLDIASRTLKSREADELRKRMMLEDEEGEQLLPDVFRFMSPENLQTILAQNCEVPDAGKDGDSTSKRSKSPKLNRLTFQQGAIPLQLHLQLLTLMAVTEGITSNIHVSALHDFESDLHTLFTESYPQMMKMLIASLDLNPHQRVPEFLEQEIIVHLHDFHKFWCEEHPDLVHSEDDEFESLEDFF